MKGDYEFLDDLNEQQRFVCINDNNFILTACPGSGKTRTITYRLAYLSTKHPSSKLLNIAITYTNKAAYEIEDRLTNMAVDIDNVWTGTIHQFCMRFILRPYSMYSDKLSKGYKIIDEYIKEKYVKEIADEIGIKGYIKELYKNHVVMSRYYEYLNDKREIDFDNILKYSLELVEQKPFIANNIGSLIRSIHVDEYQDTNEIQYLILSKIIIANRKINIIFVGDVNQAIFRGLGSVAKAASEIRTLFTVEFTEYCLHGCYRSTQRVVDYYVNFEVESTGVVSVAEYSSEKGLISYVTDVHKDELADSISKIILDELANGVLESEICIVAPQWDQIFPIANKLREILPDLDFNAPNISPIKYDPLNIYFLIAQLLFTRKNIHPFTRRKIANEIISIIKDDYNIEIANHLGKLDVLKAINSIAFTEVDGVKTLRDAIKGVFDIIGIQMNDELKLIYDEFFDKIISRIKRHQLEFSCDVIEKSFNEKTGIVLSTIHGVKGEEYTTVIAFDLLNGHLPNWDYLYVTEMKHLRKEEANKLLYVLCSRAKKNIYLFSEKGRVTKSGTAYRPTDELACCSFNYEL